MRQLLLACLAGCLFFQYLAAGEMRWKIGNEAGYYRASDYFSQNRNQIMDRLFGAVRYRASVQNNFWNLRAWLKPEFYGFNDGITSLKILADGQFIQTHPWGNLAFSTGIQNNSYHGSNPDIGFNIFRLSGGINWKYKSGWLASFSGGYAYRDISNNTHNSLDALTAEAKLLRISSPFFNMGGGLYAENFRLKYAGSFVLGLPQKLNRGWRAGPEISLEYQHRAALNIIYRTLLHSSDFTGSGSYEQWLRVVAGKIISRNWSLFLLIDYYFSHLDYEKQSASYAGDTWLNNENLVHLKLEHDVGSDVDLYLKIGYLREDLLTGERSLTGWQSLLGIEVEL